MSNENRVTGVRYLDRDTQAEGEVRARYVVVCLRLRAERRAAADVEIAAGIPTAWRTPAAQLGRNFIPHFTGGVQCFLHDLIGKPTTNDEGFLDHAYVPSFMHTRKRDYARSFGAQFNYQNRRAVGWARSHAGLRQGVQGIGQGALSGVSSISRPTARCCRIATASSIWITRRRTRTDCRWRGAR